MDENEVLMEFLNFPLGSGESILERFAALSGAIHSVNKKNRLEQFVYIPGKRDNRVLLVAHADTIWDEYYTCRTLPFRNKNFSHETPMYHQMEQVGNTISSSVPGFGIGAKDRAGCAILWLLRNSGHSLLITNGSESEGLGSNWLMDYNQDIFYEINNHHQFVIELNRKNRNEFMCYTVGTDEFRSYVEKETNYNEPDIYNYADIVTLCHKISGVNLSIGYYDEDTEKEKIVIDEWQHSLDLCRRWLNKTDLPRFLRSFN